MANELKGQKIAILATNGVEQVELTEPRKALELAGAEVHLVSLEPAEIQAVNHLREGDTFAVNRMVYEISASEYDGLVLPGGVASPDALRLDGTAVQLVRSFFAARKPIAAICHGPWMLVEADVVRHRTLTSWPSLRTDISNAGGCWVDEEVHRDERLITSRKPEDLPAFCAKMLEVFGEATGQAASRTAAPDDAGAEGRDAAVEVSAADSFPASDPPSSLKVT
jgi:protease I